MILKEVNMLSRAWFYQPRKWFRKNGGSKFSKLIGHKIFKGCRANTKTKLTGSTTSSILELSGNIFDHLTVKFHELLGTGVCRIVRRTKTHTHRNGSGSDWISQELVKQNLIILIFVPKRTCKFLSLSKILSSVERDWSELP